MSGAHNRGSEPGCPHCGDQATVSTYSMQMERLSTRCERCGWDDIHNPKVYSDIEAVESVIACAQGILLHMHESGEMVVRDLMYRTHAQSLREEADRLEARDAAIRSLRRALNRLEALREAVSA